MPDPYPDGFVDYMIKHGTVDNPHGIRLLVFGGRDYDNSTLLTVLLDHVHAERNVTLLIEGGARGADRLARRWALSRGIPVETYEADWDNLDRVGAVIRRNEKTGKFYDAAAGGRRNQRMIDDGRPDVAVAFPGGAGTDDMLRRLKKTQIEVIQV